jgi:hypothetical protein
MLRRLAMSVAMLSALAAASLGMVVQSASTIGGSAASASVLASVDCSPQLYGGDYLASLTGASATVTLSSDCTSTPYYLVVYSASDNVAYPVNTSSGQLCPNPVDPNSYCSFPSPSDYPQFFQSSVRFMGASATVPLPSTCWQLDVITAPVNTPSVLDKVTSGPSAFVWGEIGPPNSTCTPATPPSAPSPLTIGYWKNHTDAMAPLLPQTLGNYVVATTDEGVAVLSDPSSKYAANQLAAQLLAAELNLAAGAASCPALASTIPDANNLLAANSYDGSPSTLFGPGSADRAEAVNDASILNNYNTGARC